MNQQLLRARLQYEPSTGVFTRARGYSKVGRVATKGYIQISVAGYRYMAHRLAWLYVHGDWPQGQIDHINQNKTDNRIENLRVVSNKQNQENVTMWAHNKSGRRGVRWSQCIGKWIAEIIQHKKKIHLGAFETIIDAVAARIKAERELFTHSHHYAQITHGGLFPLGSIRAPGTNDL
jgi:hypothetical protein